jgi:RNA polymerase sigma-70 factor (ECF subfamily)
VASDRELVARCRTGDSDAVRTLIERFEADVFSICYRLLRHRHDAEDAAQEAFVRVFRSLHRWDPARALKPWILTIAVNRCRTALAKRGRRPTPMEFVDDVPSAALPEVGNELATAIAEALDGLREDHREVFILFHETGRPYEEIAEILERPVGTIKTWLHRARAQILESLQRKGLALDPSPKKKP